MNEDRCDQINEGHGKGIQGAIDQYEAKITDIVNKIKNNKLNQEAIKDGEYSQTSEIVRMVGEAHDYVVKHMIYKHEYEVSLPNESVEGVKGHTVDHVDEKSTSRTVYDGLIYGEGVCEAYTRTFKAILDRLGIPCICVYGIYSPKSTINEPHIWNYVQIEGKWYGVDATHDDPGYGRWTYTKNSGKETREFFLVGTAQLSGHHFPSGMLSSANYEFEYPTLSIDSYRDSYNYSTPEGFDVIVEKDTQVDDQTGETFDSGTYYVSYNGKNFTENAKEGKYILVRYFTYSPNSDRWDITEWNYIDPWVLSYGEPSLTDTIEPPAPKGEKQWKYVRLELPQVKRVQFAITDVPPAYIPLRIEYENKTWDEYVMVDGKEQQTPEFKDWGTRMLAALFDGAAQYTQNVNNLKIMTEEIDNEWGDYVAPPTPIKCTPYQGGALKIGTTHHIKLEFDESLALATKDSVPGVQFYSSRNESTANEYSRLDNVKWDGDKTIEFDFWASDMWGDDNMFYNFQATGLVGVDSGKVPYPATYGLVFQKTCRLVKPDGIHRVVYAQPQLMETSDIDVTKWTVRDSDIQVDEDGNIIEKKTEKFSDFLDELDPRNSQAFLDALKDRLTLVTSEPSPNRTTQMEDALENSKFKDDFENARTVNTYNISLTVCKKCLVYTGEAVRINLGFPEGTSYEDYAESGRLSFKAYHYIVDPLTDELTGEVEEIPVTVTRQGLILMVESFSPFTVTSVENKVPKKPTVKDLVVARTIGGEVKQGEKVLDGENGVLKMNENDSQTITITPDDGYEIDFVTLDGVRQKINNKQGETITVGYDNFATGAVLDVGFVAKEIHEEETEKGLSSDFEIPNIAISFEDDKSVFEYVEGDHVVIKPNVYVSGGDFTETTDENFDPETATDTNHPDYIKYEWYKTSKAKTSETPEKLENQNKKSLDIGHITLADSGASYYVVATPMKWNEKTKTYEAMKEKDKEENFNQVSEAITLEVYPELHVELTSNEEKKLEGNNVNGYTLSLNTGDTYDLTADMYRIYDENTKKPATRPITWESDDENVVKVSDSGYLTVVGYKATPVKITATVNEVNGTTKTVKLNVTASKVSADSVTITAEGMENNTVKLEASKSITLHANILPSNATETIGKWELVSGGEYLKLTSAKTATVTAKNDEATINKLLTDGEIEGTVKVTVDGKEATCTVKIVKTKVTGLSDDRENRDNINMVEGSTIEIDINTIPVNATNKKLTVTNNHEEVAKASIENNNKLIIEAKNYDPDNNQSTITVTSADNPNAKLVYTVTVLEAEEDIKGVTGVEVEVEENGKTKLKVGEGVDLNAKITPEGAAVSHVEWFIKEANGNYVTSNDYAEINNSGYVTAKKVGKVNVVARVTCQEAGCKMHESKEFSIEIIPTEVESIKILGDSNITLIRNDEKTLIAEVGPDNATDKTVTWKSSNKEVATVDNNGVVKALKTGKTTITATAGTKTAQVNLEVKPIEVQGIILDHLSLKIKDNATDVKLNVTFDPPEADQADLSNIEWTSSDETIAKVDKASGKITPVKAGTVIITAKLKGSETIYEECEVIVVPSKTNVVLYTVDQNANFIAGIGIRLTSKDSNGIIKVISEETISTGKVEFSNLEDGEYTVYVTSTPDKDMYGKPLNITNVVEMYTFKISDGEILYTGSDEDGNTLFNKTDSIVLVSTTNGEDAKVLIGDNYENIEDKYEEFFEEYSEAIKNEGKDKPNGPDIGNNPNGSVNPGDPIYSGNEENGGSTDTENNNNQGENQNNSSAPKTGDIAITTFWVIMNVSLIGILFIVCKKTNTSKKKSKRAKH